MKDTLHTAADLGAAIKAQRVKLALKTVDIAAHSQRSRDVLNRLEKGGDVTLYALFDILRAMGLSLRLVEGGLPTLEEMQARFSGDDDDAS